MTQDDEKYAEFEREFDQRSIKLWESECPERNARIEKKLAELIAKLAAQRQSLEDQERTMFKCRRKKALEVEWANLCDQDR